MSAEALPDFFAAVPAIVVADPLAAFSDSVPVIATTALPADLPQGSLQARGGDAAFRYVCRAAELALRGEVRPLAGLAYVGVQMIGAMVGVLIAHAMFAQPLWQVSGHLRDGPAFSGGTAEGPIRLAHRDRGLCADPWPAPALRAPLDQRRLVVELHQGRHPVARTRLPGTEPRPGAGRVLGPQGVSPMRDPLDPMAPEASPGTLSKRSGVRRVNNVPMYLLGGVMIAFVLMMMVVAADRAAKQKRPEGGAPEKAGSTTLFAREIAGEQTGGMIPPAARLVPPALETAPAVEPILIARPENLDLPPKPPAANALPQPAQVAQQRYASAVESVCARPAPDGLTATLPRKRPVTPGT